MTTQKSLYYKMRNELSKQYPNYKEMLTYGMPGSLSSLDNQHNQFINKHVSKFIKAYQVIALIKNKFTISTAEKSFQRNRFFGELQTLGFNTSIGTNIKQFFELWDNQKNVHIFQNTIFQHINTLKIKQIHPNTYNYSQQTIKHLVQSFNKIHDSISQLKVHEFPKLNYQHELVNNLVMSVNVYEAFLISVSNQHNWYKIQGQEKRYHQFYKNNKYNVNQMSPYMQQIQRNRNNVIKLKQKIITFEQRYNRNVRLDNFEDVMNIMQRGLQSYQDMDEIYKKMDQLIKNVKVAKYEHISTFTISDLRIRQKLAQLIKQVQNLYQPMRMSIEISSQQMKSFINRIILLVDKQSQYLGFKSKMQIIQTKLNQILQKYSISKEQAKNNKAKVASLQTWIKQNNKHIDQLMKFLQEQYQHVKSTLKCDQDTTIQHKMNALREYFLVLVEQINAKQQWLNTLKMKKNSTEHEIMHGSHKSLMMSKNDSLTSQKSIMYQKQLQKDRQSLYQKQNIIKQKDKQIGDLNQYIRTITLEFQVEQQKWHNQKTQIQKQNKINEQQKQKLINKNKILYSQIQQQKNQYSQVQWNHQYNVDYRQQQLNRTITSLEQKNIQLLKNNQEINARNQQLERNILSLQDQLKQKENSQKVMFMRQFQSSKLQLQLQKIYQEKMQLSGQIQSMKLKQVEQNRQRNQEKQTDIKSIKELQESLEQQKKKTTQNDQKIKQLLQINQQLSINSTKTAQLNQLITKYKKLQKQLIIERQSTKKLKHDLGIERQSTKKLKHDLGIEKQQTKKLQQDLDIEKQFTKQLKHDLDIEKQFTKKLTQNLDIEKQFTKKLKQDLDIEKQLTKKLEQDLVAKQRDIKQLQNTIIKQKQSLQRLQAQQQHHTISEIQDKRHEQEQQENESRHNQSIIMVPYTTALFNQDIFYRNEDYKDVLVKHIETYLKSKIVRTPLLYKYDTRNKVNFHLYIDDIKNLCLVVRTQCAFIAGFYPGVLKQKQSLDKGGLLVAISSDKSYTLMKNKPGQKNNYRGMVYDQYYAIYGNSQIRIKTGNKTIFSNFGISNSFFDSRGDKVNQFLKQKQKREVQFMYLQFYQVCFENPHLNSL